MSVIDLHMEACVRAEREGRYGDVLRMVQDRFAALDRGAVGWSGNLFYALFQWEMLAARYMPARAALARERDAQAARVLAGQSKFGDPNMPHAPSRFGIVVEMNETLNDPASTHALFVKLLELDPEAPRHHGSRALPALVAVGDFALAESFLPDPLRWVDGLNETARRFPMFPSDETAPRLAGELAGYAGDVRLRAATLRGLGREAEASAMIEAALAGLASDELRDWVRRDLVSPGAIIRALTDHRMALQGIVLEDPLQP